MSRDIHTMQDTSIPIESDTRDRLRRYKAQDGKTYTEAVDELLDEAGWTNE